LEGTNTVNNHKDINLVR